jgi:flagellar FliL protein
MMAVTGEIREKPGNFRGLGAIFPCFSLGFEPRRPIMAADVRERAMAEDKEAPEAEETEEGEAPPGEPSGGKKKLIIIAGAAVLLLVVSGAGLFFSGLLDSMLGIEEAALEPGEVPAGKIFYKLEPITVNLNVKGQTARFLQIGLTLVLVGEKDVPLIEGMVPRIIDYIVSYLRELAPEEIEGSANFNRLRENLLLRIRAAASPVLVADVLLINVFVQ